MTPVLVDKRYSLDQSDLGREPWGALLERMTVLTFYVVCERLALATCRAEKCDLLTKSTLHLYLSMQMAFQRADCA